MDAQAFRTMIVPDSQVVLARSICSTLAPTGGVGMFDVPLSADGKAPATHYVSTGYLDAEFAALMPLTEYPPEGDPVVSAGEPAVVAALCVQAGLEVTEAEVATLFSVSDVTTQDPFVAFARLGLQMDNSNEVA